MVFFNWCLQSLIWSPSPFKPSIKPSQSALQTHGLESILSRPDAAKIAPWLKKPKFHWWHQPLSHLLISWVLLFFSSFIPATEGTEQSITCAPVPSANQHRALKSILIFLVPFLSISSLPTWAARNNQRMN